MEGLLSMGLPNLVPIKHVLVCVHVSFRSSDLSDRLDFAYGWHKHGEGQPSCFEGIRLMLS